MIDVARQADAVSVVLVEVDVPAAKRLCTGRESNLRPIGALSHCATPGFARRKVAAFDVTLDGRIAMVDGHVIRDRVVATVDLWNRNCSGSSESRFHMRNFSILMGAQFGIFPAAF